MLCSEIKTCTSHLFEMCEAVAAKQKNGRDSASGKIASKMKLCSFEEDVGLCKLCPNWKGKEMQKCIKRVSQDSIIPCEERKKSYYLCNTERHWVILYHMDKGVIKEDASTKGQHKCDYLYVIGSMENYEAVILVELKGETVKAAYKQLHDVLAAYEDYFWLFRHARG